MEARWHVKAHFCEASASGVETYRNRGTATANVVDDEEQIEANPMLVFSSAQANAVVLSAFLALTVTGGTRSSSLFRPSLQRK